MKSISGLDKFIARHFRATALDESIHSHALYRSRPTATREADLSRPFDFCSPTADCGRNAASQGKGVTLRRGKLSSEVGPSAPDRGDK